MEIEKRHNKLVGGLYKKTYKGSIIFLQRVSVLSMLIGMEITRNFGFSGSSSPFGKHQRRLSIFRNKTLNYYLVNLVHC